MGYLDRKQLAFIYLTVNFSYGISNYDIYSNLKNDVTEIVKSIQNKYNRFFNNVKYYRNLCSKLDKLRYKIAFLEKLMIITRPSNLDEIKTYIKNEFIKLNNHENYLKDLKEEYYINVLSNPKKSKKIRRRIKKTNFEVDVYNKFLKTTKKLLNNNNIKSLKTIKNTVIECPVCGKKLRVNKSSVGILICPKCYFKFAVDTTNKVNFKYFFLIKNYFS